MKPIPVHAAQSIAETYGYDQVIIIARKVGDDPDPHGEHCTTYGRDKVHCGIAARVGDFLKHKVMGWHEDQATLSRQLSEAREKALEEAAGLVDRAKSGSPPTNGDETLEAIRAGTIYLLGKVAAAIRALKSSDETKK